MEYNQRRRSTQFASVIVAALFLQVIVANVLWPTPAPGTDTRDRMLPTESPFPAFNAGPRLRVVPLDPGANLSTRLLLASLQGLVNRAQVELFLDVADVAGNTTTMLAFLGSRYGVAYEPISVTEAIEAYANRSSGIVVYDPARPESINIATMVASQMGGILVGPDLAPWLAGQTGLPTLFDYGGSDWASLDAIGAYDRALRELYPGCAATLLAILPPDRWAIRDYLIATRTFVFYHPQGILATPFEVAATKRILHAAPRGIPILGWFESPTLTEENAFVQLASAAGQFVVGVQNVPNLSVLAAFGRNETRAQPASPGVPVSLEDTTYVVLAVPDGDNVDFVAGRMSELWSEPLRGTTPIAWSMSPLLVDLAPPLLDAYYDTATATDQFVAGPSGAGYLYPDYAVGEDLASYVAFSERYMEAADMDVVWLLNAFTASEIPYSSASLSTYVDGLRPAGIVLDYADQPRTRDAWVQAGASAAAPVIRSTHFWTTRENVLGKLEAANAMRQVGPQFVWLTIYTFRFDLADARALVDEWARRSRQPVEIVTPAQFFGLLRADFVRRAQDLHQKAEANPIRSLLFASTLASTRDRLRQAEAFLAAGDADRAALLASQGLEELEAVAAIEAVLVLLAVVLAFVLLAAVRAQSSRQTGHSRDDFHPGVFLFITAAVALLVFAIREAVQQNFWTYPTILIGIVFAGFHQPVRRMLDRTYPDRAPIAAALAALAVSALAIQTTAAFPLAMIGTLLALDTFLSRRPGRPAELLVGLGSGTAVGLLGGFDLMTFSVLGLLLVGSAWTARGPPIGERSVDRLRALVPGFLLALPLFAMAVASCYAFAIRLGLHGDNLGLLAGTLLILGPTLGILARRSLPSVPIRVVLMAGLATAAGLGIVLVFLDGTLWTAIGLLALTTALSFTALASLERLGSSGSEVGRALTAAIVFLPLFVVFFRLPPVSYSLVLPVLPEAIEYALYMPTATLAAACVVLLLLLARRREAEAAVGKDYPGGQDGGAVGP